MVGGGKDLSFMGPLRRPERTTNIEFRLNNSHSEYTSFGTVQRTYLQEFY